jgi:hypothetical protein
MENIWMELDKKKRGLMLFQGNETGNISSSLIMSPN